MHAARRLTTVALRARAATAHSKLLPALRLPTRSFATSRVARAGLKDDAPAGTPTTPTTTLHPLPDLPKRGPWPMSLITQSDVDTYMPHLYNRGWSIVFTHRKAALTRLYNFSDFDHIMEFVNDIAMYAREDKHHPTVKFTHNTVRINLYSHDLKANEVASTADGKPTAAQASQTAITIRDLRLAMRAEALYESWIEPRGLEAYSESSLPSPELQPTQLENFFSPPVTARIQKRKARTGRDGPARPCNLCGGAHFDRDCPLNPKRQMAKTGGSEPGGIL